MWQSGLTNDQRDRLESLQRRAIKLISGSQDYEFYCCIYQIEPIKVRLDNLAQQFFHKICDSNNYINYILPNKRPIELTNKLRQSNSLPGTLCNTNRFYNSVLEGLRVRKLAEIQLETLEIAVSRRAIL